MEIKYLVGETMAFDQSIFVGHLIVIIVLLRVRGERETSGG